MNLVRTSLAALVLLRITAACAAEPLPPNVVDAWSRSTPPSARTGVVYMTIRNESPSAETATSVESEAAARAEFHRTTLEAGVARTVAIPRIEIPPRSEVTLEPNGLHLMLVDLRRPLVAGATVRLTIRFASGLSREVDVQIRSSRPSGHTTH